MRTHVFQFLPPHQLPEFEEVCTLPKRFLQVDITGAGPNYYLWQITPIVIMGSLG